MGDDEVYETHVLRSAVLGADRTVWRRRGTAGLCVFLDGEYYRDGVDAAEAADAVEPDLDLVLVAAGSGADRHRDLACSPAFSSFLADELLPWAGAEAPRALVGLSLSGLQAAWMAHEHPERFGRVVAQSPSAWWSDEWLVARVVERGGCSARAWISVGARETATDVRHAPTGMHQVTSQVASCTRLAEAWGPTARLAVFDGGHTLEPWRAELAEALAWVLSD